MARQVSYETAKTRYGKLMATPPIERQLLVDSLNQVLQSGERAASKNEIGTVKFAFEMIDRYSGAIALNSVGLVEPPLEKSDIDGINQQMDRLRIFTEGNGDTGPTDTADLPTSEKK